MNKRELLSYLIENNTSFSMSEVLIGSGIALLLAFFQFYVYKKTYDSVKYSKSFNVTLVMTTVVTTMVMMIIGSNLALSLGMVGALSIIRFRTAIKDPKDIAFIFWSVAIGLACGAGVYIIAVIGSVVIAAILFLLCRGKTGEDVYLLTVTLDADGDLDALEACLSENVRSYTFKVSSVKPQGTDATYEIRPAKKVGTSQLCKTLQNTEHVTGVNVVAYEGLSR